MYVPTDIDNYLLPLPQFKLGEKAKICFVTGTGKSEKRVLKGKIIFKNDHYITIQTKNYKESVCLIDFQTRKAVVI